ncbi:toxic anion resistance protein [Nigerium massiliense]|uniref:toxic anion resistance protein n=1 Tax=Nigerium massiliense TaxID=1522317 RepID=UPI00058B9871|nr:toxic anion resistance protein [Nigerium massiliense]
MTEMAIDFGAITGGAPAAVGAAESSVGDALQTQRALPGNEVGELSCLKMLTPTQAEQAGAAAAQLYPKMLANTDLMATFGDQALDGVNAQVNRIFSEIGPVEIPELTSIMHEINDRMRSFRSKYDPTVPQVREAFDRFMDAVKGVFQRGRDLLEMLFEEARSIEQQLDRIAGQLSVKQRELKRNVVLCDELYKANEAAISQLIGTIAVMECVRDMAVENAHAIVIDPSDPQAREKQEQVSRITEFASAMEVRVNEFQQRLFVAWSTSPQIRNTRALHFGLGQRLALLVNLTIPTMKLTIAQWGLMLQAQQAAQMQQAVSDGANEVLQAYARASGAAVPEIARTIQTPTLKPETILEVATSLDAQATGIEEALRYGEQARGEVVAAITTAASSMAQTQQRLSSTVVELVGRAEKPVALPPAPELPEAVLEMAPAVEERVARG